MARSWISCCAVVGGILLAALSGAGAQICERADACPEGLRSQLVQAQMTPVTVEIDIFSGMPNPEWTLSEPDAAVFLDKLSGLQRLEARPRSSKLGYRGMAVRTGTGGGMYVQRGVIERNVGATTTFLLDPERSLERWLIGTGRKFLSPAVLEAIDADLRQ